MPAAQGRQRLTPPARRPQQRIRALFDIEKIDIKKYSISFGFELDQAVLNSGK
jgi:hypothetical protein